LTGFSAVWLLVELVWRDKGEVVMSLDWLLKLNWVDVVIVFVFIVNFMIGLMRGFIRTALTFLGLVVGLILAILMKDQIADWLTTIFPHSSLELDKVIAFFMTIVIVWMLALFFGQHFFREVLQFIPFGPVLDDWAGAIMSLIMSILQVSLALMVVNFYFTTTPPEMWRGVDWQVNFWESIKNSVIAPVFLNNIIPWLVNFLSPFLPSGLLDVFKSH